MNKLGLAAITIVFFAGQTLAQDSNQGWVTAWGASQQGLGEAKISNATVRMIARVTIPGDSIRIRLDNTFGTAPRSEEHTSELQSQSNLVCRLLLEKKKKKMTENICALEVR